MPDRSQYLARWSSLHGAVEPKGVVAGWLSVMYALGRPLAAARVPPDLVTLLGLLAAGLVAWLAALGGRWPVVAAAVVLASAAFDGLDGTVAVLSDRTSRWGAVLDGFVDRVAEALFLVALWTLGAPAWACVLAGALAWLHEYVRAKAASLGMADVGVVTVGERPTRVAVAGMFLLGCGVYPEAAATWATVGVGVWTGLQLVGLGHLLVVVRARLR